MSHIIDYKYRHKFVKKPTLYLETKKIIRSLLITLSAMIVILAAIFFIVINENAQKGYTLEQEKLRANQLKSENSKINTKITQETASSSLENKELLEGMQEPTEKIYVTEEDNKVE